MSKRCHRCHSSSWLRIFNYISKTEAKTLYFGLWLHQSRPKQPKYTKYLKITKIIKHDIGKQSIDKVIYILTST